MPIVLKSGCLTFPETSGLVQACNGFALPSTGARGRTGGGAPSGLAAPGCRMQGAENGQ